MTYEPPVANETVIRDNDNSTIGVVTKPQEGGKYFAHSIYDAKTKSFYFKWQAANYLHAIHDNQTGVPT